MGNEPTILSREQIEQHEETPVSHPLNPQSEMYYRSLTETAGFEQSGFHMVRVPPGKESNELHSHRFAEEFYYVISGRGLLLVDGDAHEMGPGSFAGFPANSAARLMTNPHGEDLVYFAGGPRTAFEIAEFPRLGKVMIRDGMTAYTVEADQLEKLG